MSVGGPTLQLGIKGFRDAYINAATEEPNYWRSIVGEKVDTTALMEKYLMLSDLIPSQPIEDVGGVPVDTISVVNSFDFWTHQYAMAVQLTDKQMRTDQSGLLKTIPKLLGKSDYLALEQLVADLINNGTSSTYAGIDGVELFGTHTIDQGASFSNLLAAETISYAALERMLANIKNHKSWKGNPWTTWGSFNLVTSGLGITNLAAKRIIRSTQVAGSADNDVNVAKDDIKFAGGNQFLTDSNAFTLLPADKNRNPLFLLTGLDAKTVKDPKPSEFRTIYAVASDRTAGWFCAQGTAHNTGSGS